MLTGKGIIQKSIIKSACHPEGDIGWVDSVALDFKLSENRRKESASVSHYLIYPMKNQ